MDLWTQYEPDFLGSHIHTLGTFTSSFKILKTNKIIVLWSKDSYFSDTMDYFHMFGKCLAGNFLVDLSEFSRVLVSDDGYFIAN